MAWAARLRQVDGDVALLGLHASYSAARRQVDEFNRRYQFDRAFVEPFDAGSPIGPS